MAGEAETIQALNERRVLSVLSVDICKSTALIEGLDPDDAASILDACFESLRTAIEEDGGVVISFNGDGALAVFGWPVPNERHADNACRAAWRIQHSQNVMTFRDERVGFRVGVHSGLVALRRIKLVMSSRIDAIGECVHVAAQIQKQATAGEVWLSGETAKLCRPYLTLECVDSPDKKTPGNLRVFRLCGDPSHIKAPRLRHAQAGVTFGRRAELAELKRLINPKPGPPTRFSLVGEPGIGKSHIASILRTRATKAGLTVKQVEGQPLFQTSALSIIRQLISDTIGDSTPAIGRALVSRGAQPHDVDPVVRMLFSADVAKQEWLDPTTGARVVGHLVRVLHSAIFNKPTLLILEDIHHMDAESLETIRVFAGTPMVSGVSILCTCRPEARKAAREISDRILELLPLSETEMRNLFCKLSKGLTLSRRQFDLVIERANGNPFVLEQLVRCAREGGLGNGETLPRTVESLLHARLGRLSPAARTLAQNLSLLGEKVGADLALAIAGDDAQLSSRAVRELQEFAFLDQSENGDFRFRHALIASACATSVNKEHRRKLHRRAMVAIESFSYDNRERDSWLARHAVEAGDDSSALEYYWRAAMESRRRAAAKTLMAIFDNAINCSERLGEAGETRFVDLVLLSFDTFQLQGEIDSIAPFVQRAALMAERQGRTKERCVAICQQGIVHWYRGEFLAGAKLLHSLQKDIEGLNHLPLTIAGKLCLAHQLHNLGDINGALNLVEQLIPMLAGELETQRLGFVGVPGCIVNAFTGYYLIEVGRYKEAETYSRRALKIAERADDAYSKVLARIGLGRSLICLGALKEAVECLSIGQSLIEANGFDTSKPNNLGLLCTAKSRSNSARQVAAFARSRLEDNLLRRTGSFERHYFHAGFGEALIRSGEIDAGLQEIDKAIHVGRKTSNVCILIQSLGLKAAFLTQLYPGTSQIKALRAEEHGIAERFGLARVAPPPL